MLGNPDFRMEKDELCTEVINRVLKTCVEKKKKFDSIKFRQNDEVYMFFKRFQGENPPRRRRLR